MSTRGADSWRALLPRVVLLAGLLAAASAPALHGRFAGSGPFSSPGLVATTVGEQGAQPVGAPHDAARCPQCRAIAHARTLLQAPGGHGPVGATAVLVLLAPRAPEAPHTAPAAITRGPRAPPISSLSS
jgi:hypothetical protein